MPGTNLIILSMAIGFWSTFLVIANENMIDFGYEGAFTGMMGFISVVTGTFIATIFTNCLKSSKAIDTGMKVFSALLLWCWGVFAFMKLYYGEDKTIHLNTIFTTCILINYFLFAIGYMGYAG